jgi:DNA polymerase III sliding clamp (beta) subunit (PCNA family)
MQFTCDTPAMSYALDKCKAMATFKENYPDARNILIEAVDGKIRLSTTDMMSGAVTFNVSETVAIKEEGKVSVDARSLAAFVSSVSGTLNVYVTKAGKLMVKCGGIKMSFVCAAKDVPIRNFENDSDPILNISGSSLSSVLKIAFMSAKEDDITSKMIGLTGLQFITDGETIYSMASSTTRAAYTWLPGKSIGKGKFLIPAKTCNLLLYYLHDDDDVDIYYDGKRLWFITSRFKLVTAQVNGEFPYDAVSKMVQQDRPHSVTVNADDIITALTACFNISRATGNKSTQILFTADPSYKLLNISTTYQELGDMQWPIVIKNSDGQGFTFTLLSTYIEEVLKAISGLASSDLMMELSGMNNITISIADTENGLGPVYFTSRSIQAMFMMAPMGTPPELINNKEN